MAAFSSYALRFLNPVRGPYHPSLFWDLTHSISWQTVQHDKDKLYRGSIVVRLDGKFQFDCDEKVTVKDFLFSWLPPDASNSGEAARM